MKNLLLLFTLLGFPLLLFAQAPTVTWQQTYGGSDIDGAFDLIHTDDGGFIILSGSDSYDGDVSGALGDYDFWVVKLAPNGTIEWDQNYGGSDWDWPYSIKPTLDGGYIIVGLTYSDDGDITNPKGFRDGWVVKISNIGALEWERTLGGSGADALSDVLQTPEGDYVIAGFSGWEIDGDLAGTDCVGDFWLVKLGPTGNLLWQNCYGGTDADYPRKIVATTDGYLLAGYADSEDGDVTDNHGSHDMWVIKTDFNGSLLWSHALGGSTWDEGFDLVANPDGSLYVIGETLSSDGDVSQNHGETDYWLVKLDSNGDLLWEKTFGGSWEDNGKCIARLPNGDLLISGVSGSTDGDVSGNHGSGDFWTLRVDPNGNMIWEQSAGGSDYEAPAAILLSANDDGIFLLGTTNSDDGDVSELKGDDDVWMVKLGGDPLASVTAIPLVAEELKVFPNPAVSLSSVQVITVLPQPQTVRVLSMTGQVLLDARAQAFNGNLEVELPPMPEGLYLLEVSDGTTRQLGKVMVVGQE
jgi:hypothetical protein